MLKYPDAIYPGAEFDRLTVLGVAFRTKVGSVPRWFCVVQCQCRSRPKVIAVADLLNGDTISCGCFHKEVFGGIIRVHGGAREQLYKIWKGMNNRCTNPGATRYENYGGRGIAVDSRWEDYAAFRVWALANGYHKGLQIDRRNNNDGYSPENCRFVTRTQNMQNTRRNVFVDAFGERKPISEWSRDGRCKVSQSTLRYRIKAGWDHEMAITTETTQ